MVCMVQIIIYSGEKIGRHTCGRRTDGKVKIGLLS